MQTGRVASEMSPTAAHNIAQSLHWEGFVIPNIVSKNIQNLDIFQIFLAIPDIDIIANVVADR